MKRIVVTLCSAGLISCGAGKAERLRTEIPPLVQSMTECANRQVEFSETVADYLKLSADRREARGREQLAVAHPYSGVPPHMVQDVMERQAAEGRLETERGKTLVEIERGNAEFCKLSEAATAMAELAKIAPPKSPVRAALSSCSRTADGMAAREAIRIEGPSAAGFEAALKARDTDIGFLKACVTEVTNAAVEAGYLSSPAPKVERPLHRPAPAPSRAADEQAAVRSHTAQTFAAAAAEAATAASRASGDPDAFSYALNEQKTHEVDLNGDGATETVVIAVICESTNCHPTTVSSVVGVFAGGLLNNQFELSGRATFEQDGQTLNVVAMQYGDDDPGCCPTVRHAEPVKLK